MRKLCAVATTAGRQPVSRPPAMNSSSATNAIVPAPARLNGADDLHPSSCPPDLAMTHPLQRIWRRRDLGCLALTCDEVHPPSARTSHIRIEWVHDEWNTLA